MTIKQQVRAAIMAGRYVGMHNPVYQTATATGRNMPDGGTEDFRAKLEAMEEKIWSSGFLGDPDPVHKLVDELNDMLRQYGFPASPCPWTDFGILMNNGPLALEFREFAEAYPENRLLNGGIWNTGHGFIRPTMFSAVTAVPQEPIGLDEFFKE